ncbi:acyl-CoA dehydrogenase family protein [Streptomyces sp. 7-21]|uniref:acyl-CoA dehydrogenase family protein n=1 Tax=Streptomyces sp. 7-21 TaxID=2802283 RepID=UPI00191E268D|nr:acyl-CoA dehydrogenase family protein [Streptomyces sp. 7-21]MBL1068328.1 acyl-CoA dehydrogenase family protein [Streptomyces sp. 7-21]
MTPTNAAPAAPAGRRARQAARSAGNASGHAPGFARELFLGRLRVDLIRPRPAERDPAEVRREEIFLHRLRRFCETRLDGDLIEREARVPGEVIDGLRTLGAFGMRIGREYGGLGLSHLAYCRALALVASVSPAVGALLAAHQSTGVPQPLVLFGTEEQRAAFLPRCARGEISAFLLTEPGAGSDPARLAATAVPDGDGYVLDGVKLWAANGPLAGLLTVMARVPPSPGHAGGVTAFVVEARSPGVTVEHRHAFMGLRGLASGVTRFRRVRVPASQRIGPEGAGLTVALAALSAGRLSLPAMCAGAGAWSLRIAREWSAARVQWGKPLARHEAIAGKVSFIAATAFALQGMAELTSELADETAEPSAGGGRRDVRVEAALAKLYASEMACRIADELVQIRGGRGYETPASLAARGERGVPAERLLRDLRVSRILEGPSEIMRLLIAREAIGPHLRVAGDLVSPEATLTDKRRAVAAAGAFYARWLPSLATGRGHLPLGYGDFHIRRYPDLAAHLRYAERAARRLARSTFYGLSRWHGRLEERQAFLGRVVDIGAELFAMAAACVHAERLRGREEHGREAYELADAFCQQARRRVTDLFHHLWHHTDATDRRVAGRVLDGAYAWLEEGVLDPSVPGPWTAPAAQNAADPSPQGPRGPDQRA